MKHVSLAVKEHKLNFQQSSSTLIYYFEAISLTFDLIIFQGYCFLLWVGTGETKDKIPARSRREQNFVNKIVTKMMKKKKVFWRWL